MDSLLPIWIIGAPLAFAILDWLLTRRTSATRTHRNAA
jgi:hypothetical protein